MYFDTLRFFYCHVGRRNWKKKSVESTPWVDSDGFPSHKLIQNVSLLINSVIIKVLTIFYFKKNNTSSHVYKEYDLISDTRMESIPNISGTEHLVKMAAIRCR